MVFTTRTLNPLPFADLDPHRFEDLIRSIVYDFKTWKKLEAIGRSGKDEGVDIRATELLESEGKSSEEDEVDEEKMEDKVDKSEREWLIQCKREKSITPAKVDKIVNEAILQKTPAPYGFILAAACDFSRATRDKFYGELHKKGVQEFYLWGKSELENTLFLPKNDHLLFAFFGISLQVKARSLKTRIRSTLSTKKKLISVLGDIESHDNMTVPVILRDPESSYDKNPHIDGGEKKWKHYLFWRHEPEGIVLVVKRFFAYIDDKGKKWDAITNLNDEEFWKIQKNLDWETRAKKEKLRKRYFNYWYFKIPEKNQAMLLVKSLVRYEDILAVDPDGDIYNPIPHIYVVFRDKYGPFDPEWRWDILEQGVGWSKKTFSPYSLPRTPFFPKKIPLIKTPKKNFEEEKTAVDSETKNSNIASESKSSK